MSGQATLEAKGHGVDLPGAEDTVLPGDLKEPPSEEPSSEADSGAPALDDAPVSGDTSPRTPSSLPKASEYLRPLCHLPLASCRLAPLWAPLQPDPQAQQFVPLNDFCDPSSSSPHLRTKFCLVRGHPADVLRPSSVTSLSAQG